MDIPETKTPKNIRPSQDAGTLEKEITRLRAENVASQAELKAKEEHAAEARARIAALQVEVEAARKETQEYKDAKTAYEAAEVLKNIPDMSEKNEQKTLTSLRQQKKFVLTINSTESDSSPVPISVNGVAYLAKRDTELLVPKGVINVMNLSKVGNPVQEKVGDVIVTKFQSTKRFSYSYRDATAEDESKLAGK